MCKNSLLFHAFIIYFALKSSLSIISYTCIYLFNGKSLPTKVCCGMLFYSFQEPEKRVRLGLGLRLKLAFVAKSRLTKSFQKVEPFSKWSSKRRARSVRTSLSANKQNSDLSKISPDKHTISDIKALPVLTIFKIQK